MAQQRWRAATIAIALAAASPAAADALQYQAPDGCPDELAFRQALPASATDDRGTRFVATVESDGATWTATLVVETGGRGAIVARLVDTTCKGAVARLAAATVLAVRAAPAPASTPKRPVPIDPDRVRALRIGGSVGYGRNAIDDGLVLDLDATYGDDARLGGWLRASTSSRHVDDGVAVSYEADDVSIGAEGCFQRRYLELCVRAGAGLLKLRATYTTSDDDSARAYLDVGGRLGAIVSLRSSIALRVAVEGSVVSHHQPDDATSIDPDVSRLRATVGFVFIR